MLMLSLIKNLDDKELPWKLQLFHPHCVRYTSRDIFMNLKEYLCQGYMTTHWHCGHSKKILD